MGKLEGSQKLFNLGLTATLLNPNIGIPSGTQGLLSLTSAQSGEPFTIRSNYEPQKKITPQEQQLVKDKVKTYYPELEGIPATQVINHDDWHIFNFTSRSIRPESIKSEIDFYKGLAGKEIDFTPIDEFQKAKLTERKGTEHTVFILQESMPNSPKFFYPGTHGVTSYSKKPNGEFAEDAPIITIIKDSAPDDLLSNRRVFTHVWSTIHTELCQSALIVNPVLPEYMKDIPRGFKSLVGNVDQEAFCNQIGQARYHAETFASYKDYLKKAPDYELFGANYIVSENTYNQMVNLQATETIKYNY